MKFELKPHQHKGVRAITHFNGTLLIADEMGVGKTVQPLWWLKENPSIRPAVIVCPAHLRWVWEDQAKSHCKLRSIVIEGQKTFKLNPKLYSIVILSYDVLRYWTKRIVELQPQILIIDECQYLKNRSSKRGKSTVEIGKVVPRRIALSASPLVNRPAELWPTLNLLWPSAFPNFFSYALRYCHATRRPWGWDYTGASRLPELHKRLKDLGMIRRLKSDVLPDLPPILREVVPVEIPMKEYIKARDHFVTWIKERAPERADRAIKAEKMVQLNYLLQLAAEEKIPVLIEWINNYLESTDEKLAVYGIHKVIVRGIYDRFKKTSVCIDGDVSQTKRRGIVNQFQSDKKIRLFFGNMQAAGTGITIVAAPHLLFAELSWVPGDHSQVEGRIHRIGQNKTTSYTYLVARDTLEEKLCGVIQAKQEVISSVMDGTRRRRRDLDIYSQLTNYLLKGS